MDTIKKIDLNYDGKVAVVTGASHGLGRQICQEFAIRDAQVVAIDILAEILEETKDSVNDAIEKVESSGTIDIYACDLTKSDKVEELIEKVVKKFGKIDILVNVAGGVVGQVHQPVDEVTDEEWRKVIEVNLYSTFYMIRAVAPLMKKEKYGRIINISSGAGRSSSLTGIQAYTSSKAGQIGLTRQMARELGPYGITVNNVAPGFVLSNPTSIKQWENMSESTQKELVNSISVKRLGKPEDIAYPVLFFASDFTTYVTGQVISADGGKQLF